MFKKKKQKRTLDKIGEQEYNFNFESEKNSYCYLCCIYAKKKNKKENIKFNTYREWRKNICDRYNNYESEQLLEFSKYLNQRIRNIESGSRYWELLVPVILTLLFTNLFNFIINAKLGFNGISLVAIILVLIFIEIIVALPVIIIVWITMKPIWDNVVDRNFLADYKEIIDYMIQEREKVTRKD